MEKVEPATAEKILTPDALATWLHITAKRLRQFLRADYPRDTRNKKWEIPLTLAKKVERDYKARIKEREAKKQAQIKEELEGKEWQ